MFGIRSKESFALSLILCGFLVGAGYLVWILRSDLSRHGVLEEHGSYFVYIPKQIEEAGNVPLIMAFSPDGNAPSMIDVWSAVADRYGWIVGASKEFHNGVGEEIFREVRSELNEIEEQYPVDRSKIILAGFSGGAMGCYQFVSAFKDLIRGVVANTGMMDEMTRESNYPSDKIAVFLASPTDFRYQEMKRDKDFLEGKDWRTAWIEFEGGHVLASRETYEKAAEWLAPRL